MQLTCWTVPWTQWPLDALKYCTGVPTANSAVVRDCAVGVDRDTQSDSQTSSGTSGSIFSAQTMPPSVDHSDIHALPDSWSSKRILALTRSSSVTSSTSSTSTTSPSCTAPMSLLSRFGPSPTSVSSSTLYMPGPPSASCPSSPQGSEPMWKDLGAPAGRRSCCSRRARSLARSRASARRCRQARSSSHCRSSWARSSSSCRSSASISRVSWASCHAARRASRASQALASARASAVTSEGSPAAASLSSPTSGRQILCGLSGCRFFALM
mmetsp:Transcript_96163/g.250490  ORF Transcript_96163/g.250490 Transcript_96163/m.250490 type:complete len:269 (-) Transcript_96163:439-1245(-)